jgi:hypothetical protein
MSTFLIIKSIIIGFVGAGSYYLLAAFIFLYFPMPLFYNLRERIGIKLKNKHKKPGDFSAKLWNLFSHLLILSMRLIWIGLFIGYGFFNLKVVNQYCCSNQFTLHYWAISSFLPFLWALVKFVKILRINGNSPLPKPTKLSFIEQIAVNR